MINLFKIFCLAGMLLITFSMVYSQNNTAPDKTALLLIDIQDFYFPGGNWELTDPVPAAEKAAQLLKKFRAEKKLVVHVQHKASSGFDIHKSVKPADNEKIFTKSNVNCFKDTGLLEYLKKNDIKYLVICGMQTHMCVEAATRAASDIGFKCTVIHDACATKVLKFGDREVSAEDVHYSTLSTLGSYAKVINLETFLGNGK